MNNPLRNISIFAVILLFLFLMISKQENENFTKSNKIFNGDETKVSKVLIHQGINSIQLNKLDTSWHISGVDTLVMRKNRIDDFFDKVLNVKRTTIRSKKPSNWMNYSVDDSMGTHLIIMDSNDETIGHYVFGRSKTDWAHNFVRMKNMQSSKNAQNNVYETSESIIHLLNTSVTYWGEKLPDPEFETAENDSLGV